jgi:hypothetical protein
MIAVAGRLGHANAVVTMMVYAHVDKLVDRGRHDAAAGRRSPTWAREHLLRRFRGPGGGV